MDTSAIATQLFTIGRAASVGARELAELPPLGLAMSKRSINRVYESGNFAALADMVLTAAAGG